MSNLIVGMLNVNAVFAFFLVGVLFFAEDALFVGFVIRGENAVVIGGVGVRGAAPMWCSWARLSWSRRFWGLGQSRNR